MENVFEIINTVSVDANIVIINQNTGDVIMTRLPKAFRKASPADVNRYLTDKYRLKDPCIWKYLKENVRIRLPNDDRSKLLSLMDHFIDEMASTWDIKCDVEKFKSVFFDEYLSDTWAVLCTEYSIDRNLLERISEAVFEEIVKRQKQNNKNNE